MAVVTKFLFDTEFGEVTLRRSLQREAVIPDEPPPPPPPPPPMFSEQELQLARDQAFEAGKRAGIHEAEAATLRLTATALQSLSTGLMALGRDYVELAGRRERNAVRAAMAVARRLLPALVEREGAAELEALFAEQLSHLVEEPRLTVRIHEAILEETRQRLTEMTEGVGFEGRLMVIADPAVAVGDGRIEWADGGMERSQARFWQDVDAAVERGLGSAMEADDAPEELEQS